MKRAAVTTNVTAALLILCTVPIDAGIYALIRLLPSTWSVFKRHAKCTPPDYRQNKTVPAAIKK